MSRPASSPEIVLPPRERRELGCGLRLVVLERRHLPLVTLRLVLRAGGAQEPRDAIGVSSLTARLVRRGAGPRDARAYAEQLDAIGGLLGAHAGLDQLVMEAEFTTETTDVGLALFLDALREPTLADDEFQRERARLEAEIRESRDDADEIAEEAFLHHLHPEHPYGRCAVGSQRAIARLQREDVVSFHERCWVPSGGVLVVVGDVDRERMADRIEAELGSWRADRPPTPPPPDPPRLPGRRVVLVDDPGSRQVQYRLGCVGIARDDPRWYDFLLANTVLGGGFSSRLVDRVRVDEGLTYGIHSRFVGGRVPGPFMISTFTADENLERLHSSVSEVLNEHREQGPTESELSAARSYMIGLQPRRLETPEGLASALAEVELHDLGDDAITHHRHRLAAVTRQGAATAARELLPSEDALLALVGDADRIAERASALGTSLDVVPLDFGERLVEDAS